MKKRVFGILGFGLIVIGVVILLGSFTGITGLVTLEGIGKTAGSIIGIVFIFAGISFLLLERTKESKLKTILEDTLASGRVGTYSELRRYAKKAGCELMEGTKHTEVYYNGRKITEIPRHRENIKKGTYRAIARSIYNAVYGEREVA